MLFNPKESIDFNGNTAPFIQFNYVRIQALLRKATAEEKYDLNEQKDSNINISPKEKELIIKLHNYSSTLQQSAREYSPALIANYAYELAKDYSQYYHDTPVFKESNQELILFRLQLAKTIGAYIQEALRLLGINVPDRM